MGLALAAASAALEVSPSVLRRSMVEDYAVVRARRAVSHFAVGSAARSPGVRLGGTGLYACGDWVDRTGHASWSTEKAVVTGRQAAAAVAADFKLRGVDSAVLPAEAYISQYLHVPPCVSLSSPHISPCLPRCCPPRPIPRRSPRSARSLAARARRRWVRRRCRLPRLGLRCARCCRGRDARLTLRLTHAYVTT